uniref:DnaJ_C domain-containing protein n=1 Tax=Anopheles coluzzii TaxID=1518534 RepID=A0A6E8VQP2_ANOCL
MGQAQFAKRQELPESVANFFDDFNPSGNGRTASNAFLAESYAPPTQLLTKHALSFNVDVPLDLEELFWGTRRDIIFQRMITVGGRTNTIHQMISIEFTPHMRDGQMIFLEEMGHQVDAQRGDVWVVLRQIVHPVFRALGDDLISSCTLPLSVALLGGTVEVTGMDGIKLYVNVNEPEPFHFPLVKTIDGQGLRTPNGRGRLVIIFDVNVPRVPTSLRDATTNMIRQIENAPEQNEDA